MNMDAKAQSQTARLADLNRTAGEARPQAERGLLFCSRAGLALVNAAFELFECDALYDLAWDVAREAGLDRDGLPLDERRSAR
jgi:hypothetical protein